MGNLIKTMTFVFVVQLFYAQTIKTYPSIIVIEKDTLVCFTTEQSKQIAVWNEQRKECVELSKNDNHKISELHKITTTQTGIILNLENEIIQHKQNFEDKNSLLLICEDEKKSFKKEIRKQKIGKWISIIGGVALSVFCLTI